MAEPRFRLKGPRKFRVVVPLTVSKQPFDLGGYRTRAAAEQAIADRRRLGHFAGYDLRVEETTGAPDA